MSRPEVSVVLATHDRPERLRRALTALRAQTLYPDRYEIVVVDDGSEADTAAVLADFATAESGPRLTALRLASAGGPARARNLGWRSARAPLVAFTDDDCEATPGWLAEMLAAAESHPGAFVQGPTTANPSERARYGPFSHTLENATLGPGFETANILYPRSLLERFGGFDSDAFSLAGGEDTDLAWKAIEAGIDPVWAPTALMHHAVTDLGPLGKLRAASRWEEAMVVYKRHASLRATRCAGIFWNRHHLEFARALAALSLPQRLWWLRWMLAAPYVSYLVERRSGPLLAPYLILYDAIEMSSVARGSIRHGVLVV